MPTLTPKQAQTLTRAIRKSPRFSLRDYPGADPWPMQICIIESGQVEEEIQSQAPNAGRARRNRNRPGWRQRIERDDAAGHRWNVSLALPGARVVTAGYH